MVPHGESSKWKVKKLMNYLNKVILFFCFLFLLLVLAGCTHLLDQSLESNIESQDEIKPPQFSVTASAVFKLSLEETLTPEPTLLPIIEEAPDCGMDDLGHILFLSDLYYKSLFVMDGSGCNVYQIMEDASGSPDWTVDGKKIAVGCENNRQICILDAEKTLSSCYQNEDGGICDAVILEKYPLPEGVGEKMIYNLSWSGDQKKILVEYSILPNSRSVYLLHLETAPRWELVLESLDVKTDYSPTEDRMIMEGLKEIDFQNWLIRGFTLGYSPQWSPDGKMVAYLYPSLGGERKIDPEEPYKLDVLKIDQGAISYPLYEARLYDPKNWQRRNVIFSDNEYRILSWSPDSKYIAFVGDYRYEGDSQIFRLDIETGEIFVLTTKLDDVYGEMQYIAPAWGP